MIARILGNNCCSCKALHVNMHVVCIRENFVTQNHYSSRFTLEKKSIILL